MNHAYAERYPPPSSSFNPSAPFSGMAMFDGDLQSWILPCAIIFIFLTYTRLSRSRFISRWNPWKRLESRKEAVELSAADSLALYTLGIQRCAMRRMRRSRGTKRDALYCWGSIPFSHSLSANSLLKPRELDMSTYATGFQHGVRQVSTSGKRVLFVTERGDVYEAGCLHHNTGCTSRSNPLLVHGFLHARTQRKSSLARSPPLLMQVSFVACGPQHSAAVTSDGDLYTWGEGTDGRLGHGVEFDEASPRKVMGLLEQYVASTACGHAFTLAVTVAGSVFSWGSGKYGQLGHGNKETLFQPRRIEGFPKWRKNTRTSEGLVSSRHVFFQRRIVSLACGAAHACAVDSTGKVFAWGVNTRGQCARPVSIAVKTIRLPLLVKGISSPVLHLSCGRDFSAAVTRSGQLYTWGYGSYGELGHQEMKQSYSPLLVNPGPCAGRFLAVACGTHHVCAVVEKVAEDNPALGRPTAGYGHKSVLCWGRNLCGELGIDNIAAPTVNTPTAVSGIKSFRSVKSIAAGDGFTLLLTSSKKAHHEASRLERRLRQSAQSEPHMPADKRGGVDAVILQRERDVALRNDELTRLWKWSILPDFENKRRQKHTKTVWLQGIPWQLRCVVWPLALGNGCKLTLEMYTDLKQTCKRLRAMNKGEDARKQTSGLIAFDLPRVFPKLGLFGEKEPLNLKLRNILEALALLRPDIGYVQGMSYLAANVCLQMRDEYKSFELLANLLCFGHLPAFFLLDNEVIYGYYALFEEALYETPGCSRVALHLCKLEVHPHLYLFNWLQTLFVKVLPIDVANRIWDGFFLEGTGYLLRAAIAVVKLFAKPLLSGTFEDCIKLLSCSPGEHIFWTKTITEEALFKALENIDLTDQALRTLKRLDTKCQTLIHTHERLHTSPAYT